MPLSKPQRFGLITVIICMLAVAVASPRFGMIAIFVAIVCMLALATAFSHAGRLSQSLQHFKNRRVDIRVWGERFPQQGDGPCEIHSIRALSDGLHLFVRCGGAETEHVKIAQPRMESVSSEIAQIAHAKYVQWAGKQCDRVAGQPAVTLTVVSNPPI